MADEIGVRVATAEDWAVIVDFNCRLAAESEGKQLDPRRIVAGVQALLADPRKGRYFLACCHGEVVGQMMHTWEWSDWRNGQIWWLQSVYVLPEFRRRGVFRRLFAHLQQQAESDPEVIGLRLYVEAGNQTALETYRRMGLESAGYLVLEQIFSE